MTLAQIMKLALRQLDEDIEDISDHDELFRAYANMGNQIIMRQFYQPREVMMMRSDDEGCIFIDGMDIERVLTLTDAYGRTWPFEAAADGSYLRVPVSRTELSAVCLVRPIRLTQDMDEPQFPEYAHHALVDYICYRCLMNGNAAKQGRAQMYHASFLQTAQQLMPQGSVTRMRNLYAASSIHAKR